MRQQQRRILVLGGWSPGPLEILERQLDGIAIFEEPTIPMPPSGFRWCWNPFWILLVLYVVVVLPWLMGQAQVLLGSETAGWILRGVTILGSLVVGRLLVAGLVWYSIRDAVNIARRRIESWRPDVLVGFSWGGGVACWLLAAGGWDGPTILLAPTVHAMARVCCMSSPLVRTKNLGLVHVFHADDDGFCPGEQVPEFRAAGCDVQLCRDNHVLCRRSTVDKIEGTLRACLAGTDANNSSENNHNSNSGGAAYSGVSPPVGGTFQGSGNGAGTLASVLGGRASQGNAAVE